MSLKKAFLFLAAGGYVAALLVVGAGTIIGLRQFAGWRKAGPGMALDGDLRKAAEAAATLKKKLDSLAPKGIHIVIDTGANRFYLKKGKEIVRQGLVSTGSGDILPDPSGKRQWIFDTPRGEYAVKSKVENPYWVKPDWAFIEEGEPIPKNKDDRVVGGELGDYALGFGSGYFLHGTLYTRLLGRNVTHGCVRIGDEDLKFLFKSSPIGTKIFIY
jgi:lipoprotein-anchoring transpeptidase ErfK/SrfK